MEGNGNERRREKAGESNLPLNPPLTLPEVPAGSPGPLVCLRPEHPGCRLPEKRPVVSGRLLQEEAEHLEGVVDLGGQVVAVLEADLSCRPLEMDEDPAVHFLAVGVLELDGELPLRRLGAGSIVGQTED